jgi:hypothetical protein
MIAKMNNDIESILQMVSLVQVEAGNVRHRIKEFRSKIVLFVPFSTPT